MSTINIDDVNSIPSNEAVHTQQLNDGIVINQPLLSYTQINVEPNQNSSQHLPTSTSICENNEITPIVCIHDDGNDYNLHPGNIHDIKEYRIWSIFTMLFCFTFIGVYAVGMSRQTKTKKLQGDYLSARYDSNMTALLNIIGTLSGIVIYSLGGLRLTGHIVMNSFSK
ncbi:unnamed protein product [Adineta steineri]|uniref:Uncharacterized protein n=1 Tax=Adineta steineri TaxID=433720 RepID=A0A818SXC4_9BILA|nr:unnamed protein product [Adineta steineri]CAF3671943.1 unnamed protein product [Adineta steineri]